MSYQWIEECFLKQPGTEKDFQPEWEVDRYLLRGKMYAMVGIHGPSGRPMVTMKLPPDYSDMLRREHKDIVPGYYSNKVHWSTVFVDGSVPKEVVLQMIPLSHKCLLETFSKKIQQEILQK